MKVSLKQLRNAVSARTAVSAILLFTSALCQAQHRLPAPLQSPPGGFEAHADIGAPFINGEVNEYGGGLEVIGSGSGFDGSSDEFHFIWREITGSFSFSARVSPDLLASDGDLGVAALMVRDSIEPTSAYFAGVFDMQFNLYSQWRERGGTLADRLPPSGSIGPITLPREILFTTGGIEIRRLGDLFQLWFEYQSIEGEIEWALLDEQTLQLNQTVLIGAAVASREPGFISFGIFRSIDIDPLGASAHRRLAAEHIPFGGGIITDNRIELTPSPHESSLLKIVEQMPNGVAAANLRPDAGEAFIHGNQLVWQLEAPSESMALLYDLEIDASVADRQIRFNGTIGDVSIMGIDRLLPLRFQVPYSENASIVLDGIISDDEYLQAYSETFDHSDRTPPGTHWLPMNGETPFEDEHVTFHILHNDTFIYVAVDVHDALGLDFIESQYGEIWQRDSVELYLDGNLSRLTEKERNRHGAQLTVMGDGSFVNGDDPPDETPLPDGGFASSNGLYWNYAARVKDNGLGYVVEYRLDKERMLSPADRHIIGFDIFINSALPDGEGMRTGKWAYWNTKPELQQPDRENWDDENAWAVIELLEGDKSMIHSWMLH